MKRMPGGRKAAGKRGRGTGNSSRWLSYNWPGCRVLLSGLERALTWAGEPLRRSERNMSEPKGKLDAMTGYSFSTPVRSGGGWVRPVVAEVTARKANGPEGLRPVFDGDAWEHADWRYHEEQVRRLRGRIFKAVQEGDWPEARNLQKLMVRHEALVFRMEVEDLDLPAVVAAG